MNGRRTPGAAKIGIVLLAIILLEAVSDAAVMVFLGGWTFLVLPFMIFLQLGFDFVFIIALGFWHYSGRGSRVIQ